jgi:hypothetical protein
MKGSDIGHLGGDGGRRRNGLGKDRPDFGPGAGRHRQSQRICGIRTTVMRHYLLFALAIGALAGRVHPLAAEGLLIDLAGRARAGLASQAGARLAVLLAAVAVRADHDQPIAAPAPQAAG